MSEMICITCPLGCHLSIERTSPGEISVTGNRCSRGEAYAREELLSPKRMVTTTCAIAGSRGSGTAQMRGSRSDGATPEPAAPSAAPNLYRPRRVPVRTRSPFPKEKVPELLALLAMTEVALPVSRGEVVLANALDTGVDILVTRTM